MIHNFSLIGRFLTNATALAQRFLQSMPLNPSRIYAQNNEIVIHYYFFTGFLKSDGSDCNIERRLRDWIASDFRRVSPYEEILAGLEDWGPAEFVELDAAGNLDLASITCPFPRELLNDQDRFYLDYDVRIPNREGSCVLVPRCSYLLGQGQGIIKHEVLNGEWILLQDFQHQPEAWFHRLMTVHEKSHLIPLDFPHVIQPA